MPLTRDLGRAQQQLVAAQTELAQLQHSGTRRDDERYRLVFERAEMKAHVASELVTVLDEWQNAFTTRTNAEAAYERERNALRREVLASQVENDREEETFAKDLYARARQAHAHAAIPAQTPPAYSAHSLGTSVCLSHRQQRHCGMQATKAW
ncbi:hypothetical protein JCM10207_008732 [Rhodosporidiobolus poonsookiae]